MHSPEAVAREASTYDALIPVAYASIEHGLRTGEAMTVDLARFDPALRERGASFVTLHVGPTLRGCTGSLEAVRPLVEDVAHHAFCAAFRDTRFAPLRAEELEGLRVHVSILGPREPIAAASEAALLAALRPGIDGLVLEEGALRSTFLPAVWDQLPAPREFLLHLKRKAGLPSNYWSDTLRFSRYEVVDVGA
jgi:hypothetical protein